MRDFMRLMQLLAANTAQILDLSHYANDLGVDLKTIITLDLNFRSLLHYFFITAFL